MSFNLYPIKQAQEIKFIPKTSKRNHPGLMFNNEIVILTSNYKYLGIIFDSKLSFGKHVKSVLKTLVKLLAYFEKSKVSSLEHP